MTTSSSEPRNPFYLLLLLASLLFVANIPLDRKINGLGGHSLASPFSRRSVLQT